MSSVFIRKIQGRLERQKRRRQCDLRDRAWHDMATRPKVMDC